MRYEKIKSSPFVILGGGPAGCAAALSALKQGVDNILIVERGPFDRHKIGEIFLTQTVLEMQNLGISKEMCDYGEFYKWGKKYAAAYVHGKDRTPWRVPNNHPAFDDGSESNCMPHEYINKENNSWYTFMVKRHEFDDTLRELCKKRGIKILHGAVRNIYWINEDSYEETNVSKIDIETVDRGDIVSIRPRFVLDATGQMAVLPRSMHLRRKIDDWDFQSRYTYLKGVDYDTAMKHKFYHNGSNILSHDDGWVWIANLGKDVSSVGVVSKNWSKDNNLYKKLSMLPESKIFGLDKAAVVDYKGNNIDHHHFYAHHNYRFRSEKIRGENWVCAGDSAMFLDPLLSQGVTLAMSLGSQAGNVAAKILNGEWSPVESLRKYEQMYVNEIELLNKIVSQWYEPDFSFGSSWSITARNISSIFGREVGNDIESFRWLSNLENFHNIVRDGNNNKFLQDLSNVNNIKSIHNFENNKFIAI